jgi:hypothetical protein
LFQLTCVKPRAGALVASIDCYVLDHDFFQSSVTAGTFHRRRARLFGLCRQLDFLAQFLYSLLVLTVKVFFLEISPAIVYWVCH